MADKYSVVVQWSDEDEGFIATSPELEGLSAFGDTQNEAYKELMIAKDGYIEVFKEDGCHLPEPDVLDNYSGQTRLRMPKSLHADLSREARRQGVSLNSYLVYLLSERNALNKVSRKINENQQTVVVCNFNLDADNAKFRPETTPTTAMEFLNMDWGGESNNFVH